MSPKPDLTRTRFSIGEAGIIKKGRSRESIIFQSENLVNELLRRKIADTYLNDFKMFSVTSSLSFKLAGYLHDLRIF